VIATLIVPPSGAGTGAWSQPLLLNRDSGFAENEAMAASQDGSRAIAVFEIQDPNTYLLTAYVSIFTKHVWSAPHLLTVAGHNCPYIAKPTMSADGKRAMVLLVDQNTTTFVSIPEVVSWNGSAWSAPKALGPSTTGSLYLPSIALSANGTTGVAAWTVAEGTPSYVVSTSLSSGTWSDATVLSAPDVNSGQPIAATSRDGKVQMVEFNQATASGVDTKVVTRAADAWRPAVTLPATASSSGGLAFAVSADGRHGGCVWTGKITNGYALYYSQMSAGKWSTKQIAASPDQVYFPTLAMSSDASVVAVGFNTATNSTATPTVLLQAKGVWAKPTALASSHYAGMMSVSVTPDGKRVAIAWYGQGGDATVHVHVQFKTGPYWTAAFDPQTAGQIADYAAIELSGDGAVSFVEAANRASDTVRQVWVRTWTAPPTIGSVVPAAGKIKGGNKIVIRGSALLGTTVVIGGKKAKVVAGTSVALTVLVPAHKVGKVSITVSTVGGSVTKANAYTYKK
jgi:hypothetical protein